MNDKSMEDRLRNLPYEKPPAELLDRLLADIPADVDAKTEHSDSWMKRLRYWIRSCKTGYKIAGVAAILLVLTGAGIVYRCAFISEGFRKYGIQMGPNSNAIRVAVKAYRDEYGADPVTFRQLTTPIAFFDGPWDPYWGPHPAKKSPVLSDAELREIASRPKWYFGPYMGHFNDYRLWQPLTKKEREAWVRFEVERNFRGYLIREWFSPAQRQKVLQIREAAVKHLYSAVAELLARKAPKPEFEHATLTIYKKWNLDPIQKVFQEERLERPLFSTIRPAIRQYRAKYGRDPKTLGDLKQFGIEHFAPGLIEWQGDRPLKPVELDTKISKWIKPPWGPFGLSLDEQQKSDAPELFSREPYNWRTYIEFVKRYGERDVYDGFVHSEIDRYFQGYLPYYPFTRDEREDVLALRDALADELIAKLKILVKEKVSQKAFEDAFEVIHETGAAEFYKIFQKVRERQPPRP